MEVAYLFCKFTQKRDETYAPIKNNKIKQGMAAIKSLFKTGGGGARADGSGVGSGALIN